MRNSLRRWCSTVVHSGKPLQGTIASGPSHEERPSFLVSVLQADPSIATSPFSDVLFGWKALTDAQRAAFAIQEVQAFNVWLDSEWLQSNPKYTAAHFAGAVGSVEALRVLHTVCKAPIANPDSLGTTPLSYAANYGHASAAAYIVDAHDVNLGELSAAAFGALGSDQLLAHAGAKYNHPKIIEFLAERAALQRFTAVLHPETSCNAVGSAAASGATEAFEALYQCGANVIHPVEPKNLRTAAHLAANHGHVPILEFLADTFGPQYLVVADKSGATPAHFAAKAGSKATLEALAGMGADLDVPDRQGRTPVFYAVHNGRGKQHREALSYLLRLGVNMFHTDGQGSTITKICLDRHGPHGAMFKMLRPLVPL